MILGLRETPGKTDLKRSQTSMEKVWSVHPTAETVCRRGQAGVGLEVLGEQDATS